MTSQFAQHLCGSLSLVSAVGCPAAFRARLMFCACIIAAAGGMTSAAPPQTAGSSDKGFVLPNGWVVTPAGRHVELTDLPLNIVPLADNRRALVGTDGYNRHELSLIDLSTEKELARESVGESWFGLATSAGQDLVWWSGGGSNRIFQYAVNDKGLTRQTFDPPFKAQQATAEPATGRRNRGRSAEERASLHHFRSGLLLDAASHTLYSLDINAGRIDAIEVPSGKITQSAECGGRPYDVVRSHNRALLFVSDWAGRAVLAVRPSDLHVISRIPVGEHPNQIMLHPKDDRLFVTCASTNNVSVIDTRGGTVTETIYTPLFPKSPEGSTPDALAITPDGQTLFVANADNNCVAVIDISQSSRSQVKGFIPTGWYPTSVAVTPDGKKLLVGVGKGLQSHANATGRSLDADQQGQQQAGSLRVPFRYIGRTMSGALSIVPIPDESQLAKYTAQVYANCPYSDQSLVGAPTKEKTVVPSRVGDPCPIRHVIYIIKENRTYDQVFGDIKEGNGDAGLVMFGEKVSPNHHKLAREYVLLDNLYCNGQVSRDGHPWSTMAYNTDYVARDWHLTYSNRKGVDDDDDANLSKAPSGYLWDACARAGLDYRNYGEYGRRVSQADGKFRMEGAVPGLVGHMCDSYAISKVAGQKQRDTSNVDIFLAEYRQFEQQGKLPSLMVLSLGEDHTTGTRPGTFTPAACVACNDLALGKLVEGVSHSKSWRETAIFVIEDDAQNGPDHVDAQRTVGLVISPYVKRKAVDSTQYSTVSMIHTIELILGLPPLSQYDAAARPMFASFTDRADVTPYESVPAQIDVNAVNSSLAYGADRSMKMDFSEYDRVNDFELNEILWRSIKGVDAPLPAPVRRAIADRPASRMN
jgi:YVTN family beta-propeller protein